MKLPLDGLTTSYELHGPEGAPWLVLSHSLACSSAMWAPQIEALKGEYRILAYDTRGHGGTEAPPGPYTLEQLADDLHALLGALGVEVNVVAPWEARPSDIARIGDADFNVVMYPETAGLAAQWLARALGQPATRTVPIGHAATVAFIREVAALAGIDPEPVL